VILFWVHVEAETPERRELLQALIAWAASARREPGATRAQVCEDLDAAGVYCLSSTWRSLEDFEAYVAGPAFGVLLGALEVLGRRSCLELTGAREGAEDAVSLVRRIRGRAPVLDRGRAPAGRGF
jgi:quinol monooxygenase YgiN